MQKLPRLPRHGALRPSSGSIAIQTEGPITDHRLLKRVRLVAEPDLVLAKACHIINTDDFASSESLIRLAPMVARERDS